MNWTPEAIETMRVGWTTGRPTEGIVAELGRVFSRNAIIGKANRCGFVREPYVKPQSERPVKPPREKKKREARPKIEVVKRCEPQPLVPVPVITSEFARPWTDRASRECAYLLDDGRSCCASTGDRRTSYCAAHRAVVYRPTIKLNANSMARKYG